MGISGRLKKIAETVTPGFRVCDIGTDHGYVPIYLLRNNISPYVIACDLSEGALAKAMENREFFHLEDRMECRISDGFSALSPGEAQCAVIAGMGGILMKRILEEGAGFVSGLKEMVLSPHRDAQLVREYVESVGFSIVSEEILEDKKKKYIILKAVK